MTGNDDYKLQPARLADAARLATMSHEFVEAGLRPAWDAARIGWHVRHEDSVVLSACSAGMLAGFAIMRYGDERAHLNLLAVVPWHRRRGVARRLVGWLEETALTAGTFLITLELRERNLEGRAFYASLGYRELRQIPGYYQGVEAALRMERDVRDGRTALPGTPQQTP